MRPQQEREWPYKDQRLWLHRWLVCGSLAGSLGASILAMILTQRPLFASISATILLAMRLGSVGSTRSVELQVVGRDDRLFSPTPYRWWNNRIWVKSVILLPIVAIILFAKWRQMYPIARTTLTPLLIQRIFLLGSWFLRLGPVNFDGNALRVSRLMGERSGRSFWFLTQASALSLSMALIVFRLRENEGNGRSVLRSDHLPVWRDGRGSLDAHRDHGEPLSTESRSAYAWWLHLTYPKMEQIEIAKRAGMSQPTVSKVIEWHVEQMKLREARHLLSEENLKDMQKVALRQKCNRVISAAWSFSPDLRDFPNEIQQEVLDGALSEADRAMLIALLEVLKTLSGPGWIDADQEDHGI